MLWPKCFDLGVLWRDAVLQAMYTRPDEFGGSLFSLAVSVMTDLIHHEPQSFRQLNDAGLPDAFLTAIKVSLPGRSSAGRRLFVSSNIQLRLCVSCYCLHARI